MAFADLTPQQQQAIRAACTEKEFALLELLAGGCETISRAARILDEPRSTVQARWIEARRKVAAALREEAA